MVKGVEKLIVKIVIDGTAENIAETGWGKGRGIKYDA